MSQLLLLENQKQELERGKNEDKENSEVVV